MDSPVPRFQFDSRAAARMRLAAFLPRIPDYGANRNFVASDHPHVSGLSAAIGSRLLGEEEVIRAAHRAHGPLAAMKFIQEILWRTYWKGWLEAHPGVWTGYRARVPALLAGLGGRDRRRFDAIVAADTGITVMDRFVAELLSTGYLHNHPRMWFASYWIHGEGLPWELGADFFARHLRDSDAASNTLSWRWVAGVQTLGKAYIVRRSNLERYCAQELLSDTRGLDRLDDGRIRAREINDPSDATPRPLPDLPAVPSALPEPYGIWIHPDDLGVENTACAWLRPVSVASSTSTNLARSFAASDHRILFLQAATRDALERCAAHFRCHTELHVARSTAEGMLRWAKKQRLKAIVAMRPYVGPGYEIADTVETALREAGVRLLWCRRPYDTRLFPLAKKGFFRFWESARETIKSWL